MVTSHEVLLLSSPPSFLILFLLFICAIEFNELDSINTAEIVFMIYALGFTLEKVAAMQEHGIKGTLCCSILLSCSPMTSVQYISRVHGSVKEYCKYALEHSSISSVSVEWLRPRFR